MLGTIVQHVFRVDSGLLRLPIVLQDALFTWFLVTATLGSSANAVLCGRLLLGVTGLTMALSTGDTAHSFLTDWPKGQALRSGLLGKGIRT